MPKLCHYTAQNVLEMWELDNITEETEACLTTDIKCKWQLSSLETFHWKLKVLYILFFFDCVYLLENPYANKCNVQ
jgi:hypothetical protein